MSRIRLNSTKGDAVAKAIRDAEDKGYERGSLEVKSLYKKLSEDLRIEVANLKSKNAKLETSIQQKATVYATQRSTMQERIETLHRENEGLKTTLHDRNTELTKLRQMASSSVGGTLRKRRKKSLRQMMKEEDKDYYG